MWDFMLLWFCLKKDVFLNIRSTVEFKSYCKKYWKIKKRETVVDFEGYLVGTGLHGQDSQEYR